MPLRKCERCNNRKMLRKPVTSPLCEDCRKKDNQKRIRSIRRKKNICMRCGGKRDSELLTCSACNEKYNKRARKNHKIRKTNKKLEASNAEKANSLTKLEGKK